MTWELRFTQTLRLCLFQWHCKFALNRTFFSKPLDPKDARLCCFFLDNPNAMEAFKLHGTQNIKDLRVELMHEFVVDQLVPELVSRLKIEVDDGVTVTLTNEARYSCLSIIIWSNNP